MVLVKPSCLMVPLCDIVALHAVSNTCVVQSQFDRSHEDNQTSPVAYTTDISHDPSMLHATSSCHNSTSSSACHDSATTPSCHDSVTSPSCHNPASTSCHSPETSRQCHHPATSSSDHDSGSSSPCHDSATPPGHDSTTSTSDHDAASSDEPEKVTGRRKCVQFAEILVSGYIEPHDSLATVGSVSLPVVAEEYRAACDQHGCRPIPLVTQLLKGPGTGAILSLEGVPLSLAECEALEAVFRRVQFEEIDLSRCRLDDSACAALVDMIAHYHSACSLRVSHNPLWSSPQGSATATAAGTHSWHALALLVRSSAALRRLVAAAVPLGERSAAELCRALSASGCGLRYLCLDSCQLHGRAASLLSSALRHCRSLRHLSLADNQLTAGDACLLGHALAVSRHLHVLDLQRNRLGDAGVQQLLRALARQPDNLEQTVTSSSSDDEEGQDTQSGLLSLNLWANEFGDESAAAIGHLLFVHDTLHTLNIGGNELGETTVNALRSPLIVNTSLRQLGLQGCRIGDEGARALADALRAGAQRLVRVDLRGNLALGVAGMERLLEAVQQNPTLQRLDLPTLHSTDLLHLRQQIDDRCAANKLRAETAASSSSDDQSRAPSAKEGSTQLVRKVSAALRRVSLTCETPASSSPRKLISPEPSPCDSPGRFHVYRVDAHCPLRVRHISSESEDAITPPSSPVQGSRVLLRPIDSSVAQLRRSPVRGFVVTPVTENRLPAERA